MKRPAHKSVRGPTQSFHLELSMLRNSRSTLRIALIAVLLASLAGAWFAISTVHVEAVTEGIASFYEQGDWVESLSVFAEHSIEFVLGWTQ